MQGQFVGDCINSVQSQHHSPIEHIIVDALSTDGTVAVINEAKGREGYKRILICEKDSGPADAINKGFALATGDIVCWLNADDTFFDQSTLDYVARFFDEHPDVDVLTADGYHIDSEGAYLYPIKPLYSRCMSYERLMYMDPFLQPSTFWRRNAIRLDANLKYLFDWQFFLDMYRSALIWVYVPVYLSCYRLQDNSLTFQDKAERRYEVYKMARRNNTSFSQIGWCYCMYCFYVISERTGLNFFKKLSGKMNKLLFLLTEGRVFSS